MHDRFLEDVDDIEECVMVVDSSENHEQVKIKRIDNKIELFAFNMVDEGTDITFNQTEWNNFVELVNSI
ncbi:hypothetical protein FEZ48_06250 [Marinilactibacillus psychrotolerans]|uniref:Uncharacterized protein n=1 Tax=Marinilactibacillus psychrotolerans TaxID=191770 RepID=A0A5R9C403_9LACT|nr:hypothetical protein [Marinilactibacillus psychrotolerans]TLQ07580.1 hypothetical protein FEZ48_06250 [Marinilactibacillus psychrotolerans]